MRILHHKYSMVITFWRWFNASSQMVHKKFNHLIFFDFKWYFQYSYIHLTRAKILFIPYRLPFLCFWKFCHYRGKIFKGGYIGVHTDYSKSLNILWFKWYFQYSYIYPTHAIVFFNLIDYHFFVFGNSVIIGVKFKIGIYWRVYCTLFG